MDSVICSNNHQYNEDKGRFGVAGRGIAKRPDQREVESSNYGIQALPSRSQVTSKGNDQGRPDH